MTLNFLKKRNRRAAWSLDNLDSGLQNDEAMVDLAHAANPRHQSDLNELQKKLNEAMQKLSIKHRTVVTLFEIDGLSHQEIAEIMETPVGTVMSRLHRGRRLLRDQLTEYATARGFISVAPTEGSRP